MHEQHVTLFTPLAVTFLMWWVYLHGTNKMYHYRIHRTNRPNIQQYKSTFHSSASYKFHYSWNDCRSTGVDKYRADSSVTIQHS